MILLQEKDGIRVYRTERGILKYFDNETYRREIQNYNLLIESGIPTLRVIEISDDSILLEDITKSNELRLACESDMNDPEIAVCIAEWYKTLHTNGKAIAYKAVYDENACFTPENIELIKTKTRTADNPVWDLISERFADISHAVENTSKTLTYNDFYYSNLAVAKDKSYVIMFDYNMLGRGYAYADIRNVLYSLGDESGKAFLNTYGESNPCEMKIDAVMSVVVALYNACNHKTFPQWGIDIINNVSNGNFYRNVIASLTVTSLL